MVIDGALVRVLEGGRVRVTFVHVCECGASSDLKLGKDHLYKKFLSETGIVPQTEVQYTCTCTHEGNTAIK